jgi:glycosyltransferase involved in cell wall biosynthesis
MSHPPLSEPDRGESKLRIAVNGWFVGHTTAGSGQYIHHLLTHLPQLPKPVQLLLLVPPEATERARTFAGVIPITLEPPSLPEALRKVWWEQITIPKAAKLLDVDLLWVPYWAAPAWQPCPVAVTVHDLIPLLMPAYRGGLQHRLYTSLVRWTARRSASILTVSHASARDIATHLAVPAERIHVVYHGPNPEGAPLPTAAELDAARVRYNLPERYFLYLGGFDMRKNVEATLAAYARYLALGGDPAVKLVLAGQLPEHDSHFAPDPRRQAAAHALNGAVHFCGRIDEQDKAALYAQAVAFVFPSLYEGFGMMVLEAMAAGTPVITSGDVV